MGCGSGLLAIAIAKLWGCPVRAVDTDPEAVREAAGNATANGVGARWSRRASGEGYDAKAAFGTNVETQFDLIVANILAAPLRGHGARASSAISRRAGWRCSPACSKTRPMRVDRGARDRLRILRRRIPLGQLAHPGAGKRDPRRRLRHLAIP